MFVVLAVPRPLFASDINFTVAGTVPAVRQPSGNTCWAAAATIMVSWKTQTSLDVADVAKRAGPKFETRFKNDERLPFGETAAFLSSLGIKAEEPQNFSVAAWLELLKTHGPLWVGTNEGSAGEFLAHARIIEGIFGDGSPGGTFFRIVDPSDGSRTNDETVSSFVRKFEDIAKRENRAGRDLRPQVVHY